MIHLDMNDARSFNMLAAMMLSAPVIHTGEWQSQDTSNSPMHATYEMTNVSLKLNVPISPEDLEQITQPNLPWANVHFLERVSGTPFNPPPSHKLWPWARHNADHQDATDKFSHTYPERFWPRHAGHDYPDTYNTDRNRPNHGIRFRYGDLNDVIDLLVRSPLTRQAYLPVWFPEDTGAHHGQRVPCTLGYHFMIRDGRVQCWYPMRSCDLIRHLRDDLYLAGRLMQWVAAHVTQRTNEDFGVNDPGGWTPGTLHMTISSLHAFVGDKWKLGEMK